MTRYEKALLAAAGATIVFLTFSTFGGALLSFWLWLLAASYAVNGYGLLAGRAQAAVPALPGAVRALTGISLAIGLMYLIQAVQINMYNPVLLGVVAGWGAGLLGYWFWRRRMGRPAAPLTGLLVRVGLVVALGLVFTGRPEDYAVLRRVLLVLNRGNDHLTHNLLFHEYMARSIASTEREDHSAALAEAKRGVREGNHWLGPDSLTERYKIGGVYSQLYEAYRDMGNAAANRGAYAEALHQYELGDRILSTVILDTAQTNRPYIFPYWEEEPVWSLNHRAYCAWKLGQFGLSDSLYQEAIARYHRLKLKNTLNLALLLANVAESCSERSLAATSNVLYWKAHRILATDTTAIARERRQTNLLAMARNYLMLDSLPEAERALRLVQPVPADSNCITAIQMTRAVIQIKKSRYAEANRLVRQCLPYLRAPNRTLKSGPLMCYMLLAGNHLALGELVQAQATADSARKQVEQYGSGTGTSFVELLGLMGEIKQTLGDYSAADRYYARAQTICEARSLTAFPLPGIRLRQAILHMHMGRYSAAHDALAAAREQPSPPDEAPGPRQTFYLLAVADLQLVQGQFQAAERGYQQVLNIHRQFGQPSTLAYALAYNGLLQAATAQHHVATADSALQTATTLRAALLPGRHPLTIALGLNGSALRLQQHRPADAAALVQQARTVAEALLPPDHDTFGDLAMAEGDLARATHQPSAARAHYNRAYAVYLAKFGLNHPKVRNARQLCR